VVCASGSELGISVEAAEELKKEGYNIRVVSVPSFETFIKQEHSYRDSVIPPGDTPVITVEIGRTLGWGDLTRNPVLHIGIDHFGASAPYKVLGEKFGFTAQAVFDKIKEWLPKTKG
jgi:transketolase